MSVLFARGLAVVLHSLNEGSYTTIRVVTAFAELRLGPCLERCLIIPCNVSLLAFARLATFFRAAFLDAARLIRRSPLPSRLPSAIPWWWSQPRVAALFYSMMVDRFGRRSFFEASLWVKYRRLYSLCRGGQLRVLSQAFRVRRCRLFCSQVFG